MKIIINEGILDEATTEFVQRDVQPALMTWDEYETKFINKDNKSHSPELYNTDYATELSYKENPQIGYKAYKKLINNLKIKGKDLQLRMNNKGSIAIFDEDNVRVSVAMDFFGSLLVQTVKEYQGWGLGEIVLKEYLDRNPDADSGGFTPSGRKLTQKYYFNMVRDFLAKGFYSDLIRKGVISKDKVQEIVAQLDNVPRKSKDDSTNLNFKNREDVVYDMVGDDTFLAYNKNIIPFLLGDDDKYDHFLLDGVFGYVKLNRGAGEGDYGIEEFYFKNDLMKKAMNAFVGNILDTKNKTLSLDSKGLEFLKSSFWDVDSEIATPIKDFLNYEPSIQVGKAVLRKYTGGDTTKIGDVLSMVIQLAENLV